MATITGCFKDFTFQELRHTVTTNPRMMGNIHSSEWGFRAFYFLMIKVLQTQNQLTSQCSCLGVCNTINSC